MKRLWLILLTLSLAACGGSSPPTPTPAETVSENPINASRGGSFTITISGDITATISGQSAYIDAQEQGLTLPLFDPNAVSESNARGITLVMPGDISPGTYTINSYYDVYGDGNQVIDVGAAFLEPGNPEANSEAVLFTQMSDGTLTLTNINPLAGSLEVTATGEGRTITIEASFDAIPVMTQTSSP